MSRLSLLLCFWFWISARNQCPLFINVLLVWRKRPGWVITVASVDCAGEEADGCDVCGDEWPVHWLTSCLHLQIKRKSERPAPVRRSLQKPREGVKEQEEEEQEEGVLLCEPKPWIPSSTPPPALTWRSSATHWQLTSTYQVKKPMFCRC